MKRAFPLAGIATTFLAVCCAVAQEGDGSDLLPPLPDTKPLTMQGDIASEMVSGIDRFLLREIDRSIAGREKYYHRDFSSHAAYEKSLEPNRKRLAHIVGVRDPRVPFQAPELVATTNQPALVGQSNALRVVAVRWPAFGNVHGEGLLLSPEGRAAVADVVAIADADQTPEMIAGLVDGVPAESQFARRLAESGCRVLVPALIDRARTRRGVEGRRGANLTNREFLYRSAFELGRHVVGYEVQKVLAGVDWFAQDARAAGRSPNHMAKTRIGVIGYGEGGLVAIHAAALDRRISAVCVSGYFQSRENVWQEPIDRNIFGLLEQFGDAELAAMIAPRPLIIEAARGPEIVLPGEGGAPGRLATPKLPHVRAEAGRARGLVAKLKPPPRLELIVSGDGAGPFGTDDALAALLTSLAPEAKLAAKREPPQPLRKGAAPAEPVKKLGQAPLANRSSPALPEAGREPVPFFHSPAVRQERQIREIDRHNQWLLRESPYVRKQFMSKIDTSSIAAYEKSVEWYRQFFYDEVIGRFDRQRLPANPRSRRIYDAPKFTGYEVVLDVFPDVIAYGILLLPKDISPNERRPVVVCQHGLEGRPQQIITGNHGAYHDFAARLAERGLITFSPQNLYIFGDRFRTLQRKANPIKKTLFSVIVPQHQQIVDWLKTLPQVDSRRIAFYGLSYGGKTAMRVPPLVPDYCLSICSADFNDWVWKNASTRSRYSYVWTGEYEIFEFDLGSTFNYMEMAALIAPRPFMVERGHFDGVAPDERVAYEFAKVRHLYAARLKIPDRCEIEWFAGPHTIHGHATFDFLHRHLDWPVSDEHRREAP